MHDFINDVFTGISARENAHCDLGNSFLQEKGFFFLY